MHVDDERRRTLWVAAVQMRLIMGGDRRHFAPRDTLSVSDAFFGRLSYQVGAEPRQKSRAAGKVEVVTF